MGCIGDNPFLLNQALRSITFYHVIIWILIVATATVTAGATANVAAKPRGAEASSDEADVITMPTVIKLS